ncbi:hypothetical protein ACE1MS_14995 [Lysinibacillus sp. fkY74-1]|uniref:DUF4030 domain-containing protein n=3 Tax=Lysinibacillus TaxID=400634 RepID=B1HTH2_LYSSC|nr:MULTISPECIES: hypothetical protein [Lysinibacillus]MBE5083034.1 hypothetical protein [Bacillus thuringiensis]ACA41176.1 hypothetical protein Bsph_3692 [Lysinibacillus sphaericus C3-41]EWH33097.1 hypothetical protein P799_13710 [Lysinibacillus sphaericus CBAM5]MCS1397439.1 hypothetical protein [Lysinibacillus sp. PB211]MDM5351764.1 hypothetical protein [Lysinibacillus sphaericus]
MKRIGVVTGLMLVIIAIIILFNKYVDGKPVEANIEKGPIITKEELSLSLLKDKLLEKYVGIDVKTTADKELVIQIVGGEEYVQSVKKDMEAIAKSALKTSALKDYSIVFERWEFTTLLDGNKTIGNDINLLIEDLIKGLQAFDVYEYLILENRTTITIQTTINGDNEEALQLATKMEGAVKKIVQTNVNQSDSYIIHILNEEREKIN